MPPIVITIDAQPEPITVDPARTALVMIDMQRDFLEPGGFGETLGNDVTLLSAAIAPCKALLDRARTVGMLVVHTREGHRADMVDAPRAKVERGAPRMRIGDPGPMGRVLIRGEVGHDIVPALYPQPGEPVVDKPGKGAFYATDLHGLLRNRALQLRLLGAAPRGGPRVRGLRVPRGDPGHRDPLRHLRSGGGARQRGERRGGGRQLPDHAGADRGRGREPDRLPDGQPVHQRGVHRASGLEGDGRAHRLLGGHRARGHRAVVARDHLGDVRADPGHRDLADPALHRHADRGPGLPGDAPGARSRHRARARSQPGRVGQAPDRQLARRGGHHRGRAGSRQAGPGRCALRWARDPGERRHPGRSGAGRDGRVHRGSGSPEGGRLATAGAVLTFFGFMHGEAIGVARTPMVALAYLLVAGWLFACAKYSPVTRPAAVPEMHAAAHAID